jgi:hypothetical protein
MLRKIAAALFAVTLLAAPASAIETIAPATSPAAPQKPKTANPNGSKTAKSASKTAAKNASKTTAANKKHGAAKAAALSGAKAKHAVVKSSKQPGSKQPAKALTGRSRQAPRDANANAATSPDRTGSVAPRSVPTPGLY